MTVRDIIDKFVSSKLVRLIRTKTAPRWLVLLADMLIVSFSYVIVLAGESSGWAGSARSTVTLLSRWAVVVAAFFVCTVLGKSHQRIIRLSVVEDLYREFWVVLAALVALLAVNVVFGLMDVSAIMHCRQIVLMCIVAFALLVTERLLIKHAYALIANDQSQRKRVVVLGTDFGSIELANMLKSEIGGSYEPVGLLNISERDMSLSHKSGYRVFQYDPSTIADVFMSNGIHALLFSDSHLDVVRTKYADVFLQNNLRMLSVNQTSEVFADGNTADRSAKFSTRVRNVEIEDLLNREPIEIKTSLVQDHIKGSTVLVTGACGSIGSEIVRNLATHEAGLIVLLDQAETPMHDLSLELQEKFPGIDFVPFVADVQNKPRVERAFKRYRPQYVFHAAAYKHVPMMEMNPTEAVLTNVKGTKHVADLALKYGVYKFVMVSTDKAVNPSNIMGCTKRLAEIYTQTLFFEGQRRGVKTQFITTRFGNVLGSNGSVIPLFRRQIEAGGPVTVTDRNIIRYFMTIPEACSLVLEAGCMGQGGEIYIFDMGKPVKIYDLATRMISLAGLRPGIDIEIKEIGLRPGEKLYEELLNDEENTTVTTNDRIKIAKVRTYEWREVAARIACIIALADDGQVHDMVKAMKQLVPEFKSLHSKFSDIDDELAEDM